MTQIGFSLEQHYDCPVSQVIDYLKDAGFSAVSPVWSKELDLHNIANCADKNNMLIQSLHAPHGGLYYLWNSKEQLSLEFQKNITDCIDDCSKYRIPLIVMHGWQGLDYVFPDTLLDFNVFDRIVDYAEKKGIYIAFENLEGEEYLDQLMKRYKDCSLVRYCWDSGHDHCYPHKSNFLDAFGDRLIMTHIHDNLGLRSPDGIPSACDDLHFLPFDGNINWKKEILRLKHLPKQKILNFELKKRSASTASYDLIYNNLSTEEFINLAGQRARKIANIYKKIIK